MGQMMNAVMFAVDAGKAPKSLGGDGWYSLLCRYEAGRGRVPEEHVGDADNRTLIGFWVAVGASGEDGCPDLDMSFPLDGFLDVYEYRKAHEKALKAWEKFRPWAASQGFEFGEPRLWLVQTEVA